MHFFEYVNTTFLFDPLVYFYTIDQFLVLFSWKYFINYKFLFIHLLFAFDVFLYIFIYLIIFIYFLLLIILILISSLNYVIKLNFFNKIFNLFFFLFLSFFAIFLNLIYIPRIYFNNKHFDYSFRLNLFEDFKIILNQHYSKTIIWNFWIIFLMISHLQIFLLYLKFFFFVTLRFFLVLAFSLFFFICTLMRKFIILYCGFYVYYIYRYVQLFYFIFFRIFIYCNISFFWKNLWLNYYSLIYNYIFLKITYNLTLFFFDNFNYRINQNNHVFGILFNSFFLLLKIFSIFTIRIKFLFVKIFINNLKVSKVSFYILKVLIYFLFLFLNLLLRVNLRSVYIYVYYFISFYIHIFVYLLLSLLKNIYVIFRTFFIFLYFFFNFIFLPFFYSVFKLNFSLFYLLIKYVLRLRIFYLIIIIIFLNFLDIAFLYNLLLVFVDLISYIYAFLKINFLPILNIFASVFQFNSFVYIPFFKLTFFHNSLYYDNVYNNFLDLYYWLKVQFILNFPYKYFFILKFILSFKNILYSFIYLNQFFLLLWYFDICIIYDISILIGSLFTWIYFLFNLVYLSLIFFAIILSSFVDTSYFWFTYNAAINIDVFIFFNLLSLLDFFCIKLYFLDIISSVTLYFIYYDLLNFLFINLCISWLFVFVDFFYSVTYQYPFDVFIDESASIIDNKIYLKNRLKSRFYRYYYYYYYNYRLNYGYSYLFNNNDTVNYLVPFTKFKHILDTVPSMSNSKILSLQILTPELYTKWKTILYLKAKSKFIWGARFIIYKKTHLWLSDLYRSNMLFLNNSLNPLAITLGYQDRGMFTRPGFGFYDVDSLYNIINILNLIFIIFIFYIFSAKFRQLYFPKLWYVNNSEYLWNKFRVDFTKHSLWLYTERANMLPLGITKKELEDGTRFTYADLATRAGIEQTTFLPFVFSNQFSSYYKNRYPGDLDKLMIFDYFCNISLDYIEYLKPIYLRESYHHFTELGSEEKEYLSIPYNFDVEARYEFLQALNTFFFKIDKLNDWYLPDWSFHKELANDAYYKFPEGTYFIPYDSPNSFENFTCWFLALPIILYSTSSFEFIFSMSSSVALDIFNKLISILQLNNLFDSFFYFIYLDLIVIDPDSLNSQWTFLRGIYNDSFFYPRYPLFFDYYSNLYYKKVLIFDFMRSLFFKSASYIDNLKAFILSFIILCVYLLLLLFIGVFFRYRVILFKFKDKDLDYISKFKFYFLKKYINKKLIYGFDNKT